MRLFNTHQLTFSIPAKGSYDDNMDFVEGTPVSILANGSLQNTGRGAGKVALQLQDGYLTSDVRFFFTKINIPLKSEDDDQSPVTTIIDGKEFTVWDKEDNTGFGLAADHYKLTLIKAARSNGEGW